jgi:hypothetical protein
MAFPNGIALSPDEKTLYEWHLNFRKWFSLKKFHVLYCSCEHGDGRRAFEVIE